LPCAAQSGKKGNLSMVLYGGIEAGGTEFVCAIGTSPQDVITSEPIRTTTPRETFEQVIAFFRQHDPVDAVGIGTFGPLDLRRESPTWGYITKTPKPGWSDTRFAGVIGDALGVPVVIDTDVNTAALGEMRWGAAQGLDTFIYLTVGTGIGGGGIIGGKLIHGLIHPEMGHILIPHDRSRDPYDGCCPFHGDCLEGLASGSAIQDRWGKKGQELPPDHEAWQLEAHYLALALVNFMLTLSPQRIILGGGVMRQLQLFPLIRQEVRTLLKGYVQHAAVLEDNETYIVPPQLGDLAGVMGAIALAEWEIST
jgi:fructokinase